MLIEGERIAARDAPGRGARPARRSTRAAASCSRARSTRTSTSASTTGSWTAARATSADRYDDASRAAAAGGTTTIIDFAMQVEGEGLLAPLERRLDDIRAERRRRRAALLDARGQPRGARRDPRARRARRALAQGLPGLQPARRADAGRGPARGLEGRGGGRRDHAGALRELADHPPAARGRAWRAARRAMPDFAASRPPVSEADAVGRALAFAAASGAETYCVHLSTSGAVEHLRLARMHGLAVHGECCPHHLLLDESRYLGERARRLRDEPAAAHRRAPRGALGRRSWTARSRSSPPITRPGPRRSRRPGRASSRRCTARRATACCCRCWRRRSGRSTGFGWEHVRASDGREPGAHLPPSRQGRDRTRQARRPRRAAARRRAARAAGAALLAGRQRHLPRPPARAAAPRAAARPHARARTGRSSASPRRAAFVAGAHVTPTGACETTESTRIGGLEC